MKHVDNWVDKCITDWDAKEERGWKTRWTMCITLCRGAEMGELCQINGEKIQGEMGAKHKKQGGD